jgi:hypothetical protein
LHIIKPGRRQTYRKKVEGKAQNDLDWEEMQSVAFGMLGLSPSQFWELTYHEFVLAVRGYSRKVEQEMTQSWWTARLSTIGYHQPKKFPKLNTLFSGRESGEMDESKREDIKRLLASTPKRRKIKDK